MDILSYAIASKQSRRIKKFIANPDSNSGVITVPKTIELGQTITIPHGRVAILPDINIEGEIIIEGEVFIPSGGSYNQVDMVCDNIKSKDKTYVVITKNLVDTVKDQDITGKKNFINGLTTQGENITPYTGFKNLLVNGNFDLWSMGTSQTTSGFDSDDRWNNNNAGSSKVHSQVLCTDTERTFFNATYYSRTVVTSVVGASSSTIKYQRIPDVNRLAGKTVTISFWVKADSTKNMAIHMYQIFGTGGTPSSAVDGIGAQLFQVTSTWQKKVFTISIPNITGKIIGTDVRSSSTGFQFWFEGGSAYTQIPALGNQSGTFDIAQVQIELGSQATPFEYRPFDLEAMLVGEAYPAANGLLGYKPFFQSTNKGFKNYLINGNFEIWQRGTGRSNAGAGSSAYYCDRWLFSPLNILNAISRQVSTVPYLAMSETFTAIGQKGCVLFQKVENQDRFNGKTLTLTFKFTATLGTTVEIFFSVSGVGDYNKNSIVATGLEQKISLTFSLPTTFIVNDNNNFGIRLVSSAASSQTLNVLNAQLEEGSYSTPFEMRPRALELALCQRYYEVQTGVPALRSANYTINAFNFNSVIFKISKRTTPTMYITHANVFTTSSSSVTGFIFGAQATVNDFFIIATKTSHGLTDAVLASNIVWAADAEI